MITKHIPNLITCCNLLCGVCGIILTFQGDFALAFYLMLLGGLFDFCDGLAARALKAYSPIGKELDSLADLISFGLLPSIMLYRWMWINNLGLWSYFPLLIAAFSALRLAKFNVDERQTTNFIGLPTPACALLCGSIVHYVSVSPDGPITAAASTPFLFPVFSIILSALLVSEIPIFSLKFKKGAPKDGVFKLRISFLAIVAAIAIAVAVASLAVSLIIVGAIVVYVIMNLCAAILR